MRIEPSFWKPCLAIVNMSVAKIRILVLLREHVSGFSTTTSLRSGETQIQVAFCGSQPVLVVENQSCHELSLMMAG